MTDYRSFVDLSPTILCDVLTRDRVMDVGIKPLWTGAPRVAGPVFTVKCAPGDNLMLHAAIYRAEPGSIIVAQGQDMDTALAGGNVSAIAQRRGVAAFVIDGTVRDIAESRENKFPIFGRGVIPFPGVKETLGTMKTPIVCGGVEVAQGDIIVADEEGVVVIPRAEKEAIFEAAVKAAKKDEATTLDQWEASHREKVEATLERLGYSD